MKRFSAVQVFLIIVVAAVWASTFTSLGANLDSGQRLGAQAAMISVIGAVFGISFIKKNGKGNGT